MLPLLVGEDNPYSHDPSLALYPHPPNSAGGRLPRILGLSRADYMRLFDRENLCQGRWSLRAARARAVELSLERRPALVLLGKRVCDAFQLIYTPFQEQAYRFGQGRPRLLVLPHPSGRCRVWNDPGSAARARTLLADFLKPAAEGARA